MSINEQELKSKIADLRDYIKVLNRNKEILKNEYNRKYSQYKDQIYNDEIGNYKFSSLSFEQLFEKVIMCLNKQIIWLEHYSNLNAEIKQTKISQYYNNILSEFDFPYEIKYFNKEDNSFEKFVNVIKSFISSKGWHIQFNIISGKTLKQAQVEPEKHRDIIVRVAGYCAQFVTLDRTTQNDIISRTEQRI